MSFIAKFKDMRNFENLSGFHAENFCHGRIIYQALSEIEITQGKISSCDKKGFFPIISVIIT
ncbi:Uncharacterized protein dnm_097580 [Desulfonema magnum]|uniref:Uncharacterized protein n=1 Tax=Desulfonema magnum TaxID=45655 RepID=A0A975BZN9_9BACT|nr:Uncharacterized protein dnm_097580 [Desulfonema magnum]